MKRAEIVNRISDILREIAPDSQRVLYGSEARGDARPSSDIDILVILPDDLKDSSFAQRKIQITERLYDIEIESGVFVSPLIVLKSMWEKLKTPFTLNVIQEGIEI